MTDQFATITIRVSDKYAEEVKKLLQDIATEMREVHNIETTVQIRRSCWDFIMTHLNINPLDVATGILITEASRRVWHLLRQRAPNAGVAKKGSPVAITKDGGACDAYAKYYLAKEVSVEQFRLVKQQNGLHWRHYWFRDDNGQHHYLIIGPHCLKRYESGREPPRRSV